MEVDFFKPTAHNGLVKCGQKTAESANVDNVKVWIVKDDADSEPAQLEGSTPWVKSYFGWICVEFVEGFAP